MLFVFKLTGQSTAILTTTRMDVDDCSMAMEVPSCIATGLTVHSKEFINNNYSEYKEKKIESKELLIIIIVIIEHTNERCEMHYIGG